MLTKKEIIEYYDNAEIAYKDAWHLDTCLALHYGFWDKDVRDLKTALIKENEILSGLLNLSPNDIVLDAGCGIGGSSLYMAKIFKCKVIGITLSEKQAARATKESVRLGLDHLVKFYTADFHQVPFAGEYFSRVWFLESFGYSNDINSLLNEVCRVLKPNGRLIIADGFANKEKYSIEENKIMDLWLNNWAINTIPTLNTVTNSLASAGFHNINVQDYSDKIHKSSYKMYFYAQLALIYGKMARLFGKTYGSAISKKNTIGAKFQYIALKRKLWKYYVITAAK